MRESFRVKLEPHPRDLRANLSNALLRSSWDIRGTHICVIVFTGGTHRAGILMNVGVPKHYITSRFIISDSPSWGLILIVCQRSWKHSWHFVRSRLISITCSQTFTNRLFLRINNHFVLLWTSISKCTWLFD